MSSINSPTKVLLIGWDAADWKIIHPLLDAGKMPNLARFVKEGVMGNLATLYPPLSPLLWTSIATGKRPYKHGILGFVEPDPSGGGVRPITNISRKTRALWNMMGLQGKKSIVAGWWPSHPAEPVNGVMVSNHYQRANAPHGKPWPVRPGTVHPQRLVRNLSQLRVHPQELDAGLMMNFIPRLSEIDQEKDHRVENVAKIIADCTTINRAVTAIMHHEPWDFTAVYYDGLDHFCHGFANYHPPRLSWVSEKDFELYRNVVESGYIYHDLLLGTLIEKAGEDTIVMLVSDHGFHSDHMRPRNIPIEPAGPAAQHRHYGIFAAKGPGIKRDEIIYGASLLDICPTILTLMGLPVGEDMDGKPLINIFEKTPEVKTIRSWDEIPGEDGCHPHDLRIDPIEAKEAIDQLVGLGYIEEPDKNTQKAAEESIRELRYNLALSYMDAGLYMSAIPLLEELSRDNPDEYRFGIKLIACYKALRKTGTARSLLEDLFRRKKENAAKSVKRLKGLRESLKDKPVQEWTREQQKEFRKLRADAGRNPYAMEFLMGSLLFEEGKEDEALRHLKNAEKADGGQPVLYNMLGDVYLKMKRWEDAEKSFRKSLGIDNENSDAYAGLCRTHLKQRRNKEAVEAGLDAVGLTFHNPKAHFYLGAALQRTGRIYEAVQALKLAVRQNPNYPEALKRLAYIYKHRFKDNALAEKHIRLAEEAREKIRLVLEGKPEAFVSGDKEPESSLASDQTTLLERQKALIEAPFDLEKTTVVVSGLPRSGTSMTMQMLAAGGLSVMSDDVRKPDEDNPRGYFEHEKAKQLRRDSSWLRDAGGRAVKIVAQLLQHLPDTEEVNYRVIFTERDLDEVAASQKAMLERLGRQGGRLPAGGLKRIFSQQLRQTKLLLAVKEIPALYINYNDTLEAPAETASNINRFLGGRLDEKRMAEAVEPLLKRH